MNIPTFNNPKFGTWSSNMARHLLGMPSRAIADNIEDIVVSYWAQPHLIEYLTTFDPDDHDINDPHSDFSKLHVVDSLMDLLYQVDALTFEDHCAVTAEVDELRCEMYEQLGLDA